MINLLKKYRLPIIFILVVSVLRLWYIPNQEDLYERAEFAQVARFSTYLTLVLMALGVVIAVLYTIKVSKSFVSAGIIFLWSAVFGIGIYFLFHMFFLAGCLALNSISYGPKVHKQYSTTSFSGNNASMFLIKDLKKNQIVFFSALRNSEKLKASKPGDTIIVSFDKGLMGFHFNPAVENILQPTKGLAQWRDITSADRYTIFELLNMGWAV